MRILIVNDDSIHAHGLSEMETLAAQFSDDVWVVAPELDQSAVAHSLTTVHPLRFRKISEKKFALQGTPADCVIMALERFLPSAPDLILSGVNMGENIGRSLIYSGTLAGAREGAMQGIRSMALSQACHYDPEQKRVETPWDIVHNYGGDVLQKLIHASLPANVVLNINFPACTQNEVRGVEITQQELDGGYCIRVMDGHDGLLRPLSWLVTDIKAPTGKTQTDHWALSQCKISVTPLELNMTAHHLHHILGDVFNV